MNEELAASQKETKRMSALANKDALTGVRNKIAYNSVVKFRSLTKEQRNQIIYFIESI